MGKKAKVGKQRKDKYYQLAKETGFRSRASFKLIQLNRKFEFLQKSRVCVDLCAAPGGWMQVAQQNMPVSSIIVGVDLFPIKPIPGCICLTEDITTEKCRTAITKELQNWKADVVLNDGAPNVGKNWLHDSYQQAILTLSAVKLATQFLRKGGWFITKVFRSKDYNPLMWVFKQLFRKVHATKPQASRHESAEIFVVCQHYLAPDKIDARFFDAKHVFQDLDIEPTTHINVYHPERKQKAKAVGYPTNDHTLYHKVSVLDFINHENGLDLLQDASEIVFDDPKISNHPKTTSELKECCKDIKVLGRKELKNILSWWKALHAEFKKDDVKSDDEEGKDDTKEEEAEESGDDLDEVEKQIVDLQNEERKEKKRKKKKTLKERTKLNERLNLKMIHKGDEGPVIESDEIFNLRQIKNSKQINSLINQTPDELAENDDDKEPIPKQKRIKYDLEASRLSSSGTYYKDSDSELEMESGDENEDTTKEGLDLSDTENPEETHETERSTDEQHPLITDLDHRSTEQKQAYKARLWFQRDAFKNLLEDADEDADLDALVDNYKKKGVTIKGELEPNTEKKPTIKAATDSDYESDSSDSSEDSNYVVENEIEKSQSNSKKDGFEIVKKPSLGKRKLTEEDLALGTMMINSKRSKRDIIDAGWNRYAFNDTNLPDWFVEEESKHMKRNIPVPKEMVDDYKKKLQDINVRPIKKVVEAKARKKRRALKKLEKTKKKVESLMDNADVTDREKAKQIKQLYRKADTKKKEEIQYVVSKKQRRGGKIRSKPSGIKGRYKVVDPRMKKDLRAAKKRAKTVGRGKKQGNNKKGKKAK